MSNVENQDVQAQHQQNSNAEVQKPAEGKIKRFFQGVSDFVDGVFTVVGKLFKLTLLIGLIVYLGIGAYLFFSGNGDKLVPKRSSEVRVEQTTSESEKHEEEEEVEAEAEAVNQEREGGTSQSGPNGLPKGLETK